MTDTTATIDSNTFSLKGQRALVTGGSGGLGSGIAEALAAAGAEVLITYHSNKESADAVIGRIEQRGGRAHALQADIGDEDAVAELYDGVDKAMGGLDILIANAGIQNDAKFLDMKLEQWNAVISVNLTGHFLCAQAAARRFVNNPPSVRANGQPGSRGKIVFVSSVHERIPWAGHINYAAAKGGLGMLMRSISQELAEHGVRVNSIAPGAIATDINRDVWENPESRDKLLQLIPAGRIGEPVDVGAAVAWMVSAGADYLNGQTIYLDGGMTLYPGFIGNG